MSDRTTGLFFIAAGAVMVMADASYLLSTGDWRWAYIVGPALWALGLRQASSNEDIRHGKVVE